MRLKGRKLGTACCNEEVVSLVGGRPMHEAGVCGMFT